MKTLNVFLLVLSLWSCHEPKEPEPLSDKGCLTGIPKGSTSTGRVLLRCCSWNEFLAGSNVRSGGTASWGTYTDHEWERVSNCNEC